jgi:hypothetical protein
MSLVLLFSELIVICNRRLPSNLGWIVASVTSSVFFPFMVWEGAPADQLCFIPTGSRHVFVESVKELTTDHIDSLNRQSLHFIYCKKSLNGQLLFHSDAICNANSSHEWKLFYRIMGRREKQQKDGRRAKWGEFSSSEPRG